MTFIDSPMPGRTKPRDVIGKAFIFVKRFIKYLNSPFLPAFPSSPWYPERPGFPCVSLNLPFYLWRQGRHEAGKNSEFGRWDWETGSLSLSPLFSLHHCEGASGPGPGENFTVQKSQVITV